MISNIFPPTRSPDRTPCNLILNGPYGSISYELISKLDAALWPCYEPQSLGYAAAA